ncbi:MAG: MmoB/DmpM family protein [Gammaproteobacteria bacterium]|jgi:hypothetical protein|nr:MmoB/DmpM family protein [Gammaproteobacteria bacterium]
MSAAPRTDVSLILMQGSPEAQATLDVLEQDDPGLVIADHATFWKITSPEGRIEVDLKRVSEELGSEVNMAQWLVILSTFVGRVITEPDRFILTSEVTQIHRD